jgi:hypothetical protein
MAGERSWIFGLGFSITVVACGGAAPPPVTAPETASAPAPAAATVTAADEEAKAPSKASAAPTTATATTREVPDACTDKAACFPPTTFVDAACKRKFSDLPLYLFAGHMPWQHLYVKAEDVEPVNPYGGEQSEAWMHFGEEVLLLRKKQAGAKGVQVSGPADVDVLRWDGTCATIREEMLVTYVPAPMQSPRIIWKYLDVGSQDALLKNTVVARSFEAQKKGCHDSSLTHPTPSCEKAMRQLTDAIVLAVHQNVALPGTGSLPDWVK